MCTIQARQIKLAVFLLLFISRCYSQELEKQLWGTTTRGGESNLGVIYKTNVDGGEYAVQKYFTNSVSDGDYPTGTLTLASNGKLYGMTSLGGVSNAGVIFEIDPVTRNFSKRMDFTEDSGKLPLGSLIEAANHKLYGLASQGGTGGGTLFEFNPEDGVFDTKINFNASTGTTPTGALVQSENGKLYGITMGGGEYNQGVIFQYDPDNGSYIVKTSLSFNSMGIAAMGGIILANNGKIYGMTVTGGDSNGGVLFEFDPVSELCVAKFHFDENLTGGHSRSNLMQASNGKLYGVTFQGGAAAQGTLFEYDIATGAFEKKVDFFGNTNGGSPINELIEVADGKLFGATSNGGANGSGILFQYDANTSTLQKKFDLVRERGSQPRGALILIENVKVERQSQTITFMPLTEQEIDAEPFTLAASTTSGLPVTFTSSNNAVAMVSGSEVTIVGVGTTEITASQIGNDVYLPAENVIQTLTVKLVTSIEYPGQEKFTFYPNPTYGQVTMEGELNQDHLVLSIKDQIGREILSTRFDSETQIPDLTSLRPGVYIIQIFSENSIIQQARLVKR